MLKKLRKNTNRTIAVAILILCALVIMIQLHRPVIHPINPLVGELAPGAAPAIVRALGPGGLDRLTQVISPGNARSSYSAGTHLASGTIEGRPYGNAFDIAILPWESADADTRALRLQGIAAWHRGPGAPGGPDGMVPHIHCVWPGYPSHNPENAEQIDSFLHGWKALADRGKPVEDWRDPSIRHDEIARVRRVWEKAHGLAPLSRQMAYDALHRSPRSG